MFVRSLSGWNITIFFDEKLSRRNGPLALSLSPARICCAVAVVLFSAHACVCLARVWVRVRSDHGVWLGGVREATQATADLEAVLHSVYYLDFLPLHGRQQFECFEHRI